MMAREEQTLWRRSDGDYVVILADLTRRDWNPLTSDSNRAMCTSSSIPEEVANSHREPQSGTGYDADRQIQEGGIQSRGDSRRGREGQVPAGRWAGVQESLIGGYRHQRQGLQWLGILEYRSGDYPNRTTDARERRGTGRSRRGYGESEPVVCCHIPARAQPKGRGGRGGEALLRRMPEEFHGTGRSTSRRLPRGTRIGRWSAGCSRSLILNHDKSLRARQAPHRGLPLSLPCWFSYPLTCRGIEK